MFIALTLTQLSLFNPSFNSYFAIIAFT